MAGTPVRLPAARTFAVARSRARALRPAAAAAAGRRPPGATLAAAASGEGPPETMAKAYAVASVCVTDKERFGAEYASKIQGTLEPYGGRYALKQFTPNLKYPEGPLQMLQVILEFPSLVKAEEWHDSEAYQKSLPVRLETTDTDKTTFYIAEGM